MSGAILAAFAVFFRSRLDVSLEVLALRQQVAVLRRKRRRPVLSRLDRLFWIMLRSVWPRWSDVSRDRETSDRNRMASKRLPTILAQAIQAAGRPS
jgi:hypothetical protein